MNTIYSYLLIKIRIQQYMNKYLYQEVFIRICIFVLIMAIKNDDWMRGAIQEVDSKLRLKGIKLMG
ncbi:hypothetical protein [Clostridium tunisiense]|uniref:hypothetical protein n=1 Tax=Clostridium tunisiense TaxID=219748 RepID=UPI00178C59C7|nr:hypothetical protein [Clostridium tunisiense]